VERESSKLLLPASITGPADLRRIRRELEAIDEFINQASIRLQGKQPSLPKTSKMLDDLASHNQFNLLLAGDRRQTREFLAALQSAPIVHISFASDPPPAFLSKIVAWFRQNVDPYLLLQIGLQPSIAAGCAVRTPNKVFDLSLRQHFQKNKSLLLERLQKLT